MGSSGVMSRTARPTSGVEPSVAIPGVGRTSAKPNATPTLRHLKQTIVVFILEPSHTGRSSLVTLAATFHTRLSLRQRCAAGLDLANRFEDVVHGAAVGLEH